MAETNHTRARLCIVCGGSFAAFGSKDGNRRCCSTACALARKEYRQQQRDRAAEQEQRRTLRLGQRAEEVARRNCPTCSGPLPLRMHCGLPQTYCSDACYRASKNERAMEAARASGVAAQRAEVCEFCAGRVPEDGLLHKYCSVECRKSSQAAMAAAIRATPAGRAKVAAWYASDEGKAYGRAWRRSEKGKACQAATRAKRRGAMAVENISPFDVFERDGWKCQVCGVSTPKSRRGTKHRSAPELDHAVPLAMGGEHTLNNLQCCCRRCNLWKGSSRVVGQRGLFALGDAG